MCSFSCNTCFPTFRCICIVSGTPRYGVLDFCLFVVELWPSSNAKTFLISRGDDETPSTSVKDSGFCFQCNLTSAFRVIGLRVPVASFSGSFVNFANFVASRGGKVNNRSFGINQRRVL